MRIFHIITVSEYGGAQSVVSNLCREFDKDPQNEVFIVYGGEGEAWSDLSPRIRRLRVGGHSKKMSLLDLFVLLRLLYYRFRYRPDVVHLHSSKMGALGRIAFPRSKTIYTVHGFDSMRVAFRKFLFVEKLLAKKAFRIVGVSRYDLEAMREERIDGRLAMVYNGIPDFSEEPVLLSLDKTLIARLSVLRERYKRVVLCIARVSKQKNVALFLETSRRLPEYAFVWIGNEDEVAEAPGNVFFLGNVPAAYRYIRFCDLFMLPSNYEGMPVSILEALCMGKPVAASHVGGIPEIIRNGIEGYVLPNDPDVFAGHIEQAFANEAKYKQLCENARQRFLEAFTVDRMAGEYGGLYGEAGEL